MAIEPFHHIDTKSDDVSKVYFESKKIAHHQIDLMCLADEGNNPSILGTEKLAHFLAIWAVVCTPRNYNNTKFIEY
jgi:hypothetical protein